MTECKRKKYIIILSKRDLEAFVFIYIYMYVPIKQEKKREKRKNPKKDVNSIVYIAFLLFVFSIRGFDVKSNWTFFSEILLILTRIHIT